VVLQQDAGIEIIATQELVAAGASRTNCRVVWVTGPNEEQNAVERCDEAPTAAGPGFSLSFSACDTELLQWGKAHPAAMKCLAAKDGVQATSMWRMLCYNRDQGTISQAKFNELWLRFVEKQQCEATAGFFAQLQEGFLFAVNPTRALRE
jgi:hypothetical protein